ncbi:hypothetical protein F5J12DRAFT_711136 [Pisolithus orientalis]|uniref:uncharacterized protein n=1 Tax=Pisolithus orientalis TaxID=936130 RepID=UPI0022248B50|nr:uncharacterized protein F5J12DRAFT_711136 [Pisolithus orientalis]KAI6035482.1 hypothetical protein F5J12DRAFT_711136 [Pisolithus orientalis]
MYAYQAPYPAYVNVAGTGQPTPIVYAPQFPVPGYPPLYGVPQPVKAPTTTNQFHVAPDIPGISSEIASKQMQKLIVSQLQQSQFDAIEPQALARLELEVVAFVQRLYEGAHDYANLACRATPVAKDVLLALRQSGCESQRLAHHRKPSRYEKLNSVAPPMGTTFEPPPPRPRSPELLPSDDEGATPAIPTTLRQIPSNFPPLPPKHTYLKTPASPPKKAALPSLERKLKNASLVQESLKNLLTATEDNLGQEDGELLGHIVNWEASTYPRKRWKISAN